MMSILVETPALWQPSYDQGFARGAAEAANPNLWQGLVGLWHPTLGVTGATLRDVSGHGYHGTLSDSDMWAVGPNGTVLSFNGTDQHTSHPNAGDFDGSGPFSVHMLVRPLSSFGFDIFASRAQGSSAFTGWTIGPPGSGGQVRLQLLSNNGTGDRIVLQSAVRVYSVNVWSAVTVTYDGSKTAAGCKFFLNGKDAGASITFDALVGSIATSQPFEIGARTAAGNYANIHVDSVLLYNRALTLNEIKQLHVDPHAIVRPRLAVPVAAFGGLSQIIGGGMVV